MLEEVVPEGGDAAAARAELRLATGRLLLVEEDFVPVRVRRLLRAPPPRGVPLGKEVVGRLAPRAALEVVGEQACVRAPQADAVEAVPERARE